MEADAVLIATERLLLRPISRADNEAVFAYRSDGEANQFQGFVPTSLAEVDAFIARNPAELNLPESWFQLVMVEQASKQVIGDVGIHFLGADGFQCELGCTLSRFYQGKGLATEAMRGTIHYLFTELKKHRIIGSVDPQNVASIQLLERLGFRKEAHFKESLMVKGAWVDDVIYALLRKEWKGEEELPSSPS